MFTKKSFPFRAGSRLRPRPTAVPLALSLAVAVVLLAPSAQAQINFTIPGDAPDGGLGTVGILEVTVNGGMGDQNQARTSLQSGTGTRITGSSSTIDFFNSDGAARAHFFGDQPFLSDPNQGNGDNDDVNDIAILYRGTVRIPTAGDYTFGINSDDGFTLAFNNGASPFTLQQANGAVLDTYNGNVNGAFTFFGGRGATDSLASVNLAAGDHPFVLTYHEGGGGSGNEFFAQAGIHTSFNAGFKLVGGQASVTPPKKLVTVGTWDYVHIADNNDNLAEMIAKYNNNVPLITEGGSFTRTAEATINFHDPQGSNTGGHTPVRDFPVNTGADDNNFGGAGRVTLTLAPADVGRYTFLVFSDDSFRFRIFDTNGTSLVPIVATFGGAGVGAVDSDGDTINDAAQTAGCCGDAGGKYDLNAPGVYTLEAIFNEQGGGAGFFVYGAQGDFNSYNPDLFQLVGENINQPGTPVAAGLQLVPEPTSTALCALASVFALGMRRRRK